MGRGPGTPSGYRSICLLDEVGKILERIIATRLVQHLSREGMDLHEEQYGFREGRSTIDAIKRVRSLSEAAIERGGVCMAVSLDIANAFNTLPWDCVGDALLRRGVPHYLVGIIRDYFRDRTLEYVGSDMLWHRRGVQCEWVPLAHGAIPHQPDSTRKIDTIPDSAPTRQPTSR